MEDNTTIPAASASCADWHIVGNTDPVLSEEAAVEFVEHRHSIPTPVLFEVMRCPVSIERIQTAIVHRDVIQRMSMSDALGFTPAGTRARAWIKLGSIAAAIALTAGITVFSMSSLTPWGGAAPEILANGSDVPDAAAESFVADDTLAEGAPAPVALAYGAVLAEPFATPEVPAAEPAVYQHRIRAGETYTSVAARYYNSTEFAGPLAEFNADTTPNKLRIGAVISVPSTRAALLAAVDPITWRGLKDRERLK